MHYTARVSSTPHVTLTLEQWQAFLESLYERDDRLEKREAGQTYKRDEGVDDYVFSAHAEALNSAEVEGDLWGTLEDIEETAQSEAEAWTKIKAFYLDRQCVLIELTGGPEPEEWIVSETLARRLGLLAQ